MRFLCLATVCFSLLLASCAPEGQEYPQQSQESQQPSSSQGSGPALDGDDIKAYLENNPDVILSVLRQHPDVIFDIAQQGLETKQEAARQRQVQAELSNPKQPAIDLSRPVRGPEDAPITIVEYSDFQCPYCSKAAKVVEDVRANYGDEVRLIFKHNPLEGHPEAEIAARYFEAAGMQDEETAWELYDIIFDNQQQLAEGKEPWLESQARLLGLDMDRLAADIHSPTVDAILAQDMAEVEQYGIRGTPYFLINGVSINGAAPVPVFQEVIEAVRAKALANTAPPKAENSETVPAENVGEALATSAEEDSCIECVTEE